MCKILSIDTILSNTQTCMHTHTHTHTHTHRGICTHEQSDYTKLNLQGHIRRKKQSLGYAKAKHIETTFHWKKCARAHQGMIMYIIKRNCQSSSSQIYKTQFCSWQQQGGWCDEHGWIYRFPEALSSASHPGWCFCHLLDPANCILVLIKRYLKSTVLAVKLRKVLCCLFLICQT